MKNESRECGYTPGPALPANPNTLSHCAGGFPMYNKIYGESEFTYGEVKKLRAFLPEYNVDYLLSDQADDREE